MAIELHIRESQIEDILVMYPEIAARVLGENSDITPVVRQKSLPSGGRLDIVYIAGNRFLLIELKVEAFVSTFLQQVLEYQQDLSALQSLDQFPAGVIEPFLLVPSIRDAQRKACEDAGVKVIEYSPPQVLEAFHERMRGTTSFLSLKPVDHGIWNLGLLICPLLRLSQGKKPVEIADELGIEHKTLNNRFRLAKDLTLLQGETRKVSLSELGEEFIQRIDPQTGFDSISDAQAELLRNFIARSPFDSAAIFGIYNIVDAVWSLSRNTYPVGIDLLSPYFRDAVGKNLDWKTNKALSNGVRMYSNYAIELGLLGRVNNLFYLTPAGSGFILLLQLHKSVNFVDAMRANK
jgi:hypothetical protein